MFLKNKQKERKRETVSCIYLREGRTFREIVPHRSYDLLIITCRIHKWNLQAGITRSDTLRDCQNARRGDVDCWEIVRDKSEKQISSFSLSLCDGRGIA